MTPPADREREALLEWLADQRAHSKAPSATLESFAITQPPRK